MGATEVVLHRVLGPALTGLGHGGGATNFECACAIGRCLRASEVDRLLAGLDFDTLVATPLSLQRLGHGLYRISGTTVLHSLVARFEEVTASAAEPPAEAMAIATVVQAVLAQASFEQLSEWRLPPGIQSTIARLYRRLPVCDTMRSLSEFLIHTNPVKAEKFFGALLRELEAGPDPMGRRLTVSGHYAFAAQYVPGGEARIGARLRDTDDPWIIASLTTHQPFRRN